MISATEFNETVDVLFDQIVEIIDESAAADDVELNQGVLEITCNNKSKIIVNRHAPTQEIWVAARSGGFHFRADGGRWTGTRDGADLIEALEKLFSQQAGEPVSLTG